jgi:hypothetical protein
MLIVPLGTTTAQEICNGVVAMDEMIASCCLYSEIMVLQHRTVLTVTSNTRCLDVRKTTWGFQKKVLNLHFYSWIKILKSANFPDAPDVSHFCKQPIGSLAAKTRRVQF